MKLIITLIAVGAPAFARSVDIYLKPDYDPVELFSIRLQRGSQ